jgi:sugar lactone lactonase YvrE
MLHKSFMTLVLALVVALSCQSVLAQTEPEDVLPDNVPSLLVKANEAFAAKDHLLFRRAMEQLHQMRPNNSQYMYKLVIAHALLDEKSQAYDLMLRMQQQGLAYDFSSSDSTMNIRNTEVFDYVNDLMKIAKEPVGESEPVFTLPESVLMPETIAWDDSRQKFLIGTVAEGSIFAVGKDGQLNELLKANDENGLWAVFDILVDQARNRLWVSSAATPKFTGFGPADQGRSALFEFDLETLQLIRHYPVPVDGRPHVLGSMALGPNGDIFIVDRALPIVFSKPADEQKLKAVMASRDMISMRGIAMQPDGRIMYIADREMGILVVDMVAGRAAKLTVPATLNVGGIDGLYLRDNRLIMIQNGISPQRVMRLQLDPSGTQVTAVRPLAVAQAQFDYPSFGVIQGEDLYYFANSQWSANDGQAKAVTVLRTPLDSNADLVAPDMQRFLEQQGKAAGTQPEEAGKD